MPSPPANRPEWVQGPSMEAPPPAPACPGEVRLLTALLRHTVAAYVRPGTRAEAEAWLLSLACEACCDWIGIDVALVRAAIMHDAKGVLKRWGYADRGKGNVRHAPEQQEAIC